MTETSSPDLDLYARRLGFERPLAADLDTLRALQRAHLRTVPFENSSVLFGDPIVLDQAAFVRKLGAQVRGGFCYELNGAFASLLVDAGFAVELLEARVFTDGGRVGPRFDHLALRVTIDEPWLVDVGFGYSFLEPLRLSTDAEQQDQMGTFRFCAAADGIDLEWRHRDGRWVAEYRFDPKPHDLEDFGDTCAYQQTSPDSPFVQGWICSLVDGDGATTLSGRRLIVSSGETRTEQDVDDADLPAILAARFGIRARLEGRRWIRAGG